jgi:hypothetical protein
MANRTVLTKTENCVFVAATLAERVAGEQRLGMLFNCSGSESRDHAPFALERPAQEFWQHVWVYNFGARLSSSPVYASVQGASGFGLRVPGYGFRVQGLGLGFSSEDSGVGFKVEQQQPLQPSAPVWGLGFRI